jgi:HSP20 family protein
MVEETISWIPPIDIYESEKNYIVCAELPGVDLSNVKIEFSGLQFTIKGARRFEESCSHENYHSLEVQPGKFHRTFSLPEAVDKDGIQMELSDGLLSVTLPKSGKKNSKDLRSNH